MSNDRLDHNTLEHLFLQARSHTGWQDKSISDAQLHELYDLAKWGPTSMNCLPMRLAFLKSPAAKTRLKPMLAEGNIDKAMAAPVTVIVASDTQFYEHMPTLFPYIDTARAMYADNATLSEQTAFRNSSLQGAYLILAARSLGLDVGPMSGFDNNQVDREFFPDGRYESNFLINIGYGDHAALHPRGPRFEFEEVCTLY
ncbi:Probable NADH dehydrogenase/NAD(P)H nitroreductase [hydrothermal vent metagenome]|uniref:Probable NADH dehydrogenase/NAD(P)H nitroreductase n=1 Tax=hydrothermal vent metagenome TaxID=652676 RepID=A0A3B0YYS2_9ZZZZ